MIDSLWTALLVLEPATVCCASRPQNWELTVTYFTQLKHVSDMVQTGILKLQKCVQLDISSDVRLFLLEVPLSADLILTEIRHVLLVM